MVETFVDTLAQWVGSAVPLDFMQFRFMQLGFLALLALAPLTAVSGIQVINARMAFFSDAISHSAFAGVAIGLIFGLDVEWSMAGVAVLVGLTVMYLNFRSGLSSDTVIGIVFSAVSAFGLAVISLDKSVGGNLRMFLFGDLLTITPQKIVSLLILLVVFLVFQAFVFNRMLLICVNPMLAAVHRVPVFACRVIYSVLLSLVVIYSVHTAGVILVTALLIIPAATARNLATSIRGMFYWALTISYLSCFSGFFLFTQPWANIPTGPAIVLCSVAFYIVSHIIAMFRPKRVSDSDI